MGTERERFKVQVGLRKGSAMCPWLFKMYTDEDMKDSWTAEVCL